MKMVEIQEGIGFGIKKTRVSFVFKNKQSWDDFVNSGWGGWCTGDRSCKKWRCWRCLPRCNFCLAWRMAVSID
jgi:hypothetical protein